jgi:hypothetical protein
MAATTCLATSGCRKDRQCPQVIISGRNTTYSTQAARTGVSEGYLNTWYIWGISASRVHMMLVQSALIVDVLKCLSCREISKIMLKSLGGCHAGTMLGANRSSAMQAAQ